MISSMSCVRCELLKPMMWLLVMAPSLLFRTCVGQVVLSYNFTEEQRVGAVVGNVGQDSGILSRHRSIALDGLSYSISEQSGATQEFLFKIGSDGILRSAVEVDRDVICAYEDVCHLDLMVEVLRTDPVQYLESVKVSLLVVDLNDNAPRFEEETLFVPENAEARSELTYPVAKDPDSPQYGIKYYEQLSGQESFVLLETRVPEHAETVRLQLATSLNREEQDMYVVQLAAYDGDTPPKSGTIRIPIRVTDVNDNNPVFEWESYSETVPENVPMDTVILQVKATDADEAENGVVVYGFLRSSDTFHIDNMTGAIYAKAPLDYEVRTQYTLTVTAQNPIPNAIPVTVRVNIMVEDIDDNPPTITVDTLGSGDFVAVPEGASRSKTIAQLTVKDPDRENQEFLCALDNADFKVRSVTKTMFLLLTQTQFDREEQAVHNVTVTCMDLGDPSKKAVLLVPVYVTDMNDNSPVFEMAEYRTNTVENEPPGSFLIKVSAKDPDAAENGKIAYSLDPAVRDRLFIDPVSGNISIRTSLDRENSSVIVFNVTAHDQGSPSRSGVASVSITVFDANDEIPVFSRPEYRFRVVENRGLDTQVGQVAAVDKDGKNFNSFQYSLDSAHNGNNLFWVDHKSGWIYTKTVLDREVVDSYQMTVLATSFSQIPTTGSATVWVDVDDINDNEPEFVFPSPLNNTVVIPGSYRRGQVLVKVFARDPDWGPNSGITYTIVDGNDRGYFTMDANTGELRVSVDSIDGNIDLTIRARDQGDPPLIKVSVLRINGHSGSSSLSQKNLIIVIAIACATGFFLVVCIVFMVSIVRRNRRQKKKQEEKEAVKREAEQENAKNSAKKVSNHLLPPAVDGRSTDSDCEGMFNDGMTTDDEMDGGFKTLHNQVLNADLLGSRKSSGASDLYPQGYLHQLPSARTDRPDRHSGHHRHRDSDRQQRSRPYYINGKLIQDPRHGNCPGDRDSDSGCSADLSHSTADSGPGSQTDALFHHSALSRQANGVAGYHAPRAARPPSCLPGYVKPPMYNSQSNGHLPYRRAVSDYELHPMYHTPPSSLPESRSNSMSYHPSTTLEGIIEDQPRCSSFAGTTEESCYQHRYHQQQHQHQQHHHHHQQQQQNIGRRQFTGPTRYDDFRKQYSASPLHVVLSEEENDRTYCQEATV